MFFRVKCWLKEFPQWEGEDQFMLIFGVLAFVALIVGYFGLLINDIIGLNWKWCEPTTITALIVLLIILFGVGMNKTCSD